MPETSPNGERWSYRASWLAPAEGEDALALVNEHLEQWAKSGWELVSANAVQMLFIGPTPNVPFTSSSAYHMRHCFYWRRFGPPLPSGS